MGTAFTVPTGEVEVDLVVAHAVHRDGAWTEMRADVTYGVSPSAHVEVGVVTRRPARGSAASGEDRLELEAKWMVHDAAPVLLAASAALEVTRRPETGSTNGPGWGAEASLATSRPWVAARLRGHLEVGLASSGLEEIEGAWLNLGVERAIGRGWTAGLGGNGSVGEEEAATVVPGLAWRPGGREEGLLLAVGFPLGVAGVAERCWGVILHLELEF